MSFISSILILFIILTELIKKRQIFIVKWIKLFRAVVIISGIGVTIFVVMAMIEGAFMGCYSI